MDELIEDIKNVPFYNPDGTLKSDLQVKNSVDQLKQEFDLNPENNEIDVNFNYESPIEPEEEFEEDVEDDEEAEEEQGYDPDKRTLEPEEEEQYFEEPEEINVEEDEVVDTTDEEKIEEEIEHVMHHGVKKVKDNLALFYNENGDNIYFNVEIRGQGSSPTIPRYSVIRDEPILNKASDYYLSILRFNVPAYYAPIGQFLTKPGETQEGVYSLQMVISGVFGLPQTPEIFLSFTSVSDLNRYFKAEPNKTPNGNNIYYLFTYQEFLRSLNAAFSAAWNIIIQDPFWPFDPTTIEYAPFCTFNNSSKIFEFYFPQQFSNKFENNPPFITCFFNEALYALFSSVPAQRQSGPNGSPDGRDYSIYVIDEGINQTAITALPDLKWIQVVGEYSTVVDWNPFSKILISTNLIPCKKEFAAGGGDVKLPIITDFIPSVDIQDVRSLFQYFPVGQYRLVDLQSDGPIRNVDIDISWIDLWGNFNPFYIQPNANISMKLGFLNKELYHGNHLKNYVRS